MKGAQRAAERLTTETREDHPMTVPAIAMHETITTPREDTLGGFKSTQSIRLTGTVFGDVELRLTDDRGEVRLVTTSIPDGPRRRQESTHVWLTDAGLAAVYAATEQEAACEGAEEYADDQYTGVEL
jgi:hypothetical protein